MPTENPVAFCVDINADLEQALVWFKDVACFFFVILASELLANSTL